MGTTGVLNLPHPRPSGCSARTPSKEGAEGTISVMARDFDIHVIGRPLWRRRPVSELSVSTIGLRTLPVPLLATLPPRIGGSRSNQSGARWRLAIGQADVT
jgi:hypothetical protein